MDTPIEVLVGNLTMTNLDFCDAMLAYEPMDGEGLEERWTHWAEVAREYHDRLLDLWHFTNTRNRFSYTW